jgi:hypothetical protein
LNIESRGGRQRDMSLLRKQRIAFVVVVVPHLVD